MSLVTQRNAYAIPITAGDGSGVIVSTLNPFGKDVYITRAVLDITTQSTGASTLDIGVHAATGTSNDTIMDGLSGATAGAFDNLKNPGTNGLAGVRWESDAYLNVAEASGDVTGIIGTLYVQTIRLEDD